MVEYYNLKDRKGVLVAKVFENDPADKAGIKAQDIIISVNGKKIETSRELTSMIATLVVGEKAKVTVLRNGKEKIFTVNIAKRDEAKLASESTLKNGEAGEFGVQVSNITPEIAERLNISETDGVIVTGVDSGSKSDVAGIQTGDIIREINRKRIKNIDDFKNTLLTIKQGEPISMFIHRINTGFIVVRMVK
jgi:serine protease Do